MSDRTEAKRQEEIIFVDARGKPLNLLGVYSYPRTFFSISDGSGRNTGAITELGDGYFTVRDESGGSFTISEHRKSQRFMPLTADQIRDKIKRYQTHLEFLERGLVSLVKPEDIPSCRPYATQLDDSDSENVDRSRYAIE